MGRGKNIVVELEDDLDTLVSTWRRVRRSLAYMLYNGFVDVSYLYLQRIPFRLANFVI